MTVLNNDASQEAAARASEREERLRKLKVLLPIQPSQSAIKILRLCWLIF